MGAALRVRPSPFLFRGKDISQSGFTGKKPDKLGRDMCYSRGVHVPCSQHQPAPRQEPKPRSATAEGTEIVPPPHQQQRPKPELPSSYRTPALEKMAKTQVAEKRVWQSKGVNTSYRVTLEDGTDGLFKPLEGEASGVRRTIPAGTYYQREAAAADVAAVLGMEDLVPPVVVREVGGQVGSFVEWVPETTVAAEDQTDARFDGPEDLVRAAMFDWVIGNTDRHAGNWLLRQDDGRLVLIDHGLSFPDGTEELYSCRLLREAMTMDMPIPTKLVEEWRSKAPEIKKVMECHGLPPKAVQGALDRLEFLGNKRVVSSGTFWKLRNNTVAEVGF